MLAEALLFQNHSQFFFQLIFFIFWGVFLFDTISVTEQAEKQLKLQNKLCFQTSVYYMLVALTIGSSGEFPLYRGGKGRWVAKWGYECTSRVRGRQHLYIHSFTVVLKSLLCSLHPSYVLISSTTVPGKGRNTPETQKEKTGYLSIRSCCTFGQLQVSLGEKRALFESQGSSIEFVMMTTFVTQSSLQHTQ